MSLKQLFIQCATAVKKDAVERFTVDGVEHIKVSSATLPDDIVMNGGLYPSDEIEKSYESLERTLAPVEHPVDGNGNFISASDPYAIHNFHAGAFNSNVRRENGRVYIDKVVNVQEAMKTDRGKRLLDRINELETNDKPRPIHSSVGVFLTVEELDAPKTNASGQEYTWIARNMVFDHDAFLLDSIGAAQPSQGVGVAVNLAGKQVDAELVIVPEEAPIVNEGGLTHGELHEQLTAQISSTIASEWTMIVDIVDEEAMVIFEAPQGFFQVPYRVDNGIANIVGLPVRVDRQVTYDPKVNSKKGDAMKELLINALKEAGIQVGDDWDDAKLLNEYNQLQANQSSDDNALANDDNSQLADIVANAVAPLLSRIDSLEQKVNQAEVDEISSLAHTIATSGRYPGLDAETVKTLPLAKLKEMAANCVKSHGVPMFNQGNGAESFVPTEMPE